MNARFTARFLKAVVVTALLAVASVRVGPTAAEEPYEIDAILSLNGSAAFLGQEEAQSLGLLEQVVNREGGIHGRPVHFSVSDDQSNPQVAVQLANGLITKGVPVIIGPNVTATCNAIAPLIRGRGPVDYCLSPGVHPTADSYMFAASVPPAKSYGVMMRYIQGRHISRLAILASTDGSGQDGERSVTDLLKEPANQNITVVALEHFNPSDLSVTAQLARIKDAKPQALFVSAAGTPFGTVLHGLTDVYPDALVFSPASNLNRGQMIQYANFAVDNVYVPGPAWFGADATRSPAIKSAQQSFLNTHRAAGVHPDNANGLGWNVGRVVVATLRATPADPTSLQVRDAINRVHGFAGVQGMFNFDNDANPWGLDEQAVVMTHWDPTRNEWLAVSKPGGGS